MTDVLPLSIGFSVSMAGAVAATPVT